MATYVSYPTGGTSFPAVIVVQEIFGVNHHIQKVCDRYAQEGYVAVAPALFHPGRAEPHVRLRRGGRPGAESPYSKPAGTIR